jgi:hypothetical protein
MTATATVKGGMWPEVGVSSLTQVQGTGPGRRRISQNFSKKGLRKFRELAETLNGVVAGSAALQTNGRVEHNTELGGKRTIESESLINRVSAAGDVTVLTADFYSSLTSRTTMASPANLDGNPLGTR